MASIILGTSILVGYAVHHHKEKKAEKKRLAEEQYAEIHGSPSVVAPQHGKQHRQAVPDLPSYESVASQSPSYSADRYGEEKARRSSEDSRGGSRPPQYCQ
jgi:hypothetical protein